MLSLQPVKQAAQAAQYFARDNYYSTEEGLAESAWAGRGAQSLGLSGTVDKQRFLSLLDGVVTGPDTGQLPAEATPARRVHRPGTDLTFSAPKSVSILAEVAGDVAVRQAHETATRRALGYVEDRLVHARVTKDGDTKNVPVEGAVFALFRHNTSRNLDPQTHTHALLLNLGKTDDGKWRAIANDEIYKERKVVGAIYNNELARELRALGYALTPADKHGNFEIEGVSREQMEAFSSRRAQVKDWLVRKGVDPNFATLKQSEMAALSTRQAKKEVDHPELLTAWQKKADELGGLGALPRPLMQKDNPGGPDKSALDVAGAVKFAAAHLFEREMLVDRAELLQTALAHSSGRVGADGVLREVDRLSRQGDLIEVRQGVFAAKKPMASERWTMEAIAAEKGAVSRVLQPQEVSEKLAAEEWKSGFQLSRGQREAITLALGTTDRFVAVQGLAGTGKTTMLSNLNRLATDEGLLVRAMAPTGAAAKQLTRETGISADTVAMFELRERQLERDIAFAKQYAEGFVRRKELWIVDESSFLSQRQMSRLSHMAMVAEARVVYLGDTGQLQGVEAGKSFEMAQADGIATAQMRQINRQKTDELKVFVSKIVERGSEDFVGAEREAMRRGVAQAFDFLTERGHVHETPPAKLIDSVVARATEIQAIDGVRPLIITPFNRDRQEINLAMRSVLMDLGEIARDGESLTMLESKGWTRAQLKEAQYYAKDDVVRFNRDYATLGLAKGDYATVQGVDLINKSVRLSTSSGTINWQPHRHNQVEVYDRHERDIARGDEIRITRNSSDLKNGETVTILRVAEGKAHVRTRAGEEMQVDLKAAPHWDYAYASTVHASQGATARTTLLALPTDEAAGRARSAPSDLGANLLAARQVVGARSFYVSATRASHHFEIHTSDKDKARALLTQAQDKTSAFAVLRDEGGNRPVRPDQQYSRNHEH